MLTPKVDANLTKVVVQTIHRNLIKAVDDERKELVKSLEKYENSENANRTLISLVDDIITEAQDWGTGMREKYRELDCDKKSLDKRLYEGLKKFGEDSEIHIFEFLRKFEAYTEEQGTAKERAALLYEQYLQKNVQLELVDRSQNYDLMRAWLIKRFGDIKVITDGIIRSIAKENIPSESAPYHTIATYYRKLNSVVKKLQELPKTADIPADELKTHIYSSEFMSNLLKYVPRRTKLEFREKLIYAGMDGDRIKGEYAFTILALTVFTHFSSHDGAARDEEINSVSKERSQKDKLSPKKKSVHNLIQLEDEGSEDHEEQSEHAIHFQQTKKAASPKNRVGKPATPDLRFKFPCIIQNHSHEVGECAEFFTKTPAERQKLGSKKVCFTCMGPRVKCMDNTSMIKTRI